MKKNIFIIILVLILSLSACTRQVDPYEGVETHIVEDCIGREVRLPVEINKVGAIYAISGHTSVMLGEGEKIVSVTSGLKRDKVLTQIMPSILDATEPKAGGSINIEELLKDKPDVIFVRSDIAQNERETEKLDKFNIPYLAIEFDSIERQQFMINMIAKVYGKEDKAKDYIDYYNDVVKLVEERTSAIDESERKRVFHSINEATRTDPKNSVPAEWISKSGFKLVSTEGDLKFVENDYYASLEQILQWNPQIILANEVGVDEYILNNEKWSSLDAVKNKDVYLLPNGISRWGHPNSLEIPLAMLWTSKKFYPELFEDIDINSEVKSFYKRFFNLELTDDEVEKILLAEGMRLSKEGK